MRSCDRCRPDDDDLSEADQELLTFIAEGKPIKAIAVARQTTPEAISDAVEHLFLELAKGASTGADERAARGSGCSTR